MADFENAGFRFFSDFDSANLGKVEMVPHTDSIVFAVNSPHSQSGSIIGNNNKVPTLDIPDVEFNLWTKPDCLGTEFENGNRTWFYFGVRAETAGLTVKLNLVDLNRQSKMYGQGMTPVYRVLPGKNHWERIRDKPTYSVENNIFTLSFKFKTPENTQSITYFAFTYPYTYTDLQSSLNIYDCRFLTVSDHVTQSQDEIYYVRELICNSLEGRRIDLITISSYHGITGDREARLKNLFPEEDKPRPFRFTGKKVIFVSARVHPGETPSSFVFNGFFNMILSKDDPIAIALRRTYVFKLIPFLNPDGVANGHYRTDTRGVNLNRFYLNPDFKLHPSIYAARAVLRYHHYCYVEKVDTLESSESDEMCACENVKITAVTSDKKLSKKVSHMTLDENKRNILCDCCKKKVESPSKHCAGDVSESGLYLYMDLHGHASKKGIFMYGNHFKEDLEKNVDCMLLPKLMALNNHNFHFTNCNFTERNMYLKDRRDGMSREGSGRVSVLKLTGLVRSYTLECNYNTGRMVNVLPPTIKETTKNVHTIHVPPKYTPHVFEEVGKAMGASILDLSSSNPASRLPNSEFRSLDGLRDWLRMHLRQETGTVGFGRLPKVSTNQLAVNASANVALQQGGSSVRKKAKPARTRSLSGKTVPLSKRLPPKVRPQTSGDPVPGPSSKPPPLDSKTAALVKQARLGGVRPRKTAELAAPAAPSAESMKLHEICLVKGSGGAKKIVAKYLSDKQPCENLVVSWESSTSAPQVFSEKAVKAEGGSELKGEASASSSASTKGRYSAGYRVAKFSGMKHKRLKINKPLTGPGGSKAGDKFKSRKKMRSKLI